MHKWGVFFMKEYGARSMRYKKYVIFL